MIILKAYTSLIFCLLLCFNLIGQDDCATALPLSLGVPLSSTNVGSTLDNNYNVTTGCVPANYNSSVWFSFTTNPGMASVDLTFSGGTIGPSAILTLVDDCSTSSSYSFIYPDCDPFSGVLVTICDLIPNTTYYLQVSSSSADEGTFDILTEQNTIPNDLCANALPIPGGPMLLCLGGVIITLAGDPLACPDSEATGCIDNITPGVWYSFEVPLDHEYNLINFNPQVGGQFELFSSISGCSGLTFETCHTGELSVEPMPGATYYVLISGDVDIKTAQTTQSSSCFAPLGDMDNGGNGVGGSDLELISCTSGDPIMPCQNDQIVWWSYTVGCMDADIHINIKPRDPVLGPGGIIEGGIMVLDMDCGFDMAQYDANGTGYVCSGIVNNEELLLTDVPGGTTFIIAVGAEIPNQGYVQVTVTELATSGAVVNDLCVDNLELFNGLNSPYTNDCATPDVMIPGCADESAATVWFYYDPGLVPQDITINILSNGISSPAIAAWEECTGGFVDANCGNSLELYCIDYPIYIEIGSAVVNTGDFDIEITSQNSMIPPEIEVDPVGICSYELTDLLITIANGFVGDISVTPHGTSSINITGLNTHTFLSVNSEILNDELVNCGTETELAIYEIIANVPGFVCLSQSILVEIPVYPKLYAFPDDLIFCPQEIITLDALDYITGGSSPYQFYEWSLDGTTIIGTNQILLDYTITGSGYIQLNVIDANGCETEVRIDITTHPEPIPFLVPDVFQACQGLPPFILITSYLQNSGTIDNTVWVIRNALNDQIFAGNPNSENSYELNTELLDPGVYTIEATIFDENGCSKEASPIEITIRPTANGEIYEELDIDCNSILKFRFYSETGVDTFGNGPDNNLDGIPDQFDLNNDGIADFINITWITPTMGQFPTNSLEFIPLEDGIYQIRMETQFKCVGIVSSPFITLSSNTKPTIIGPSMICEGSEIDLVISPLTYVSYEWTNELGDSLGNSSTLIHSPIGTTYTYFLEIENQAGCTDRDTFIVDILELPQIQLSGSTSFCPGDSTLINAGGNGDEWTFSWYNSSNDLISIDSSIYISEADSFKVVVTTAEGCLDSTTFIVEERPNLSLTIIGEDICDGVTTNLDAGVGFDVYSWYDLSNNLLGDQQTLEITQGGTYIVIVKNGICSGTDSIEISSSIPPNVDIIPSISICNGSDTSVDTLINLLSISMNSDAGEWAAFAIPNINMTDLSAVSFSDVPMGTYQLIYTTNVAVKPCEDTSDTLTVIVSDCACPFIDISIDLMLCNTGSMIVLDDQLTLGSELGTWEQIVGPDNLPIGSDSEININGVSTGLYSFEYTLDQTMLNCKSSDTLTMIIVSPPVAMLENVIVCNLSSPTAPHVINLNTQLISGSGIWIDPMITGLDFSDVTSLDFTGVLPGSYVIRFETDDAMPPCIDQMFEINVEVVDCNCPPIALLDPGTYCNDMANIDLSDFISISAAGQWRTLNSNPTFVIINGTSISLSNEPGGLYGFEYTLDQPQAGCKDKDTLYIQLNVMPRIIEVLDTTACNTDDGMMSQILDLTNLVTGDVGNWIDLNGNLINDPTAVDFSTYQVGEAIPFTYETTTAQAPCINDAETMIVRIRDCTCDDPQFLAPPILCNEANGTLDLQDLVLNDKQGQWTIIESPTGGSSSLVGSVFETQDIVGGMYVVQFELAGIVSPSCQKVWQFEIEVVDMNEAQVSEGQMICTTNFLGENTLINLFDLIESGFGEGKWLNASSDTIDNPTQIDFLNSAPGDYNFTYHVSNRAPCEDVKYNITIIAEECAKEQRDTIINIGNIFSPNGDGFNDDIFPITNIDGLAINYFFVYDRWGNKVFHKKEGIANEPASGWDGKSNGQLVEQGVYVYIIEVQFNNGKKQMFLGDVTVIR